MIVLEVPPGALDSIRAHAAAAYPDECCGALIGAPAGNGTTRVLQTLALPNATDEGARRRFLVRPADYRSAEARAREAGADLVGFYHSHPDHPARPSAYDLEHAWPNLSYLIVAVAQGEPADVRSWRLLDDRTKFREETVRT
ncbi:MAG TPA: M67 family metallopeptidase [Vicinamibacterales bacterium]|nr:M67 family metallopeptidase [Vicinamibacterales bacterium]